MTVDGLSQAELFDVFSNARRRYAVRYLQRNGGNCELSSLVEAVAAWENDVSRTDVTRTQRRRVYISLYQTHLPMLDEYEIVDWHPEEHSIELIPNGDAFEPYLADGSRFRFQRSKIYLSISIVGVLGVTASWLELGPVSVDTAPVIVFLVSVAILTLGVLQLRT